MTSQQRIPVMPEGTIYDASGRVVAPPQTAYTDRPKRSWWNQTKSVQSDESDARS